MMNENNKIVIIVFYVSLILSYRTTIFLFISKCIYYQDVGHYNNNYIRDKTECEVQNTTEK